MDNRIKLQGELERILGSKDVYFQPPASVTMSYPCVVYNIGNGDVKYANDKVYRYIHKFDITFIYKKPTIGIIETMINEFQLCKFEKAYVVDNLNHYTFSLYY